MGALSKVRTRWLAGAVAGVAMLSPAHPASGQSSTGQYRVYWAGGNLPATPGQTWRDWAGSITFGDAPVHRNFTVLYESGTGLYPYAGIHQVEADADWMRRHNLRLRDYVYAQIPDVNFSGYVAIDFETWMPSWEFLQNEPSNQGPNARDHDFKDDWKDFVRANRPETLAGKTASQQEIEFARGFNDAARRFWLATLAEVKRLRPHAKVGYYSMPARTYWEYLWPDRAEQWRQRTRREYQWLYDAVDVFYPDVYALYWCLDSGMTPTPGQYQENIEQNTVYIRENVKEAREIAQGRPVIAFIWARYHESSGPFHGQLLNMNNLRQSFVVPKAAGADGVVMWDAFGNDNDVATMQGYINQNVVSLILQHASDAPQQAPSTPLNQTGGGPAPQPSPQPSPQPQPAPAPQPQAPSPSPTPPAPAAPVPVAQPGNSTPSEPWLTPNRRMNAKAAVVVRQRTSEDRRPQTPTRRAGRR